jgi:hypothetical protein
MERTGAEKSDDIQAPLLTTNCATLDRLSSLSMLLFPYQGN